MNDQNNFNCTYCNKIFSRRFNLKRHLKSVHNHNELQWGSKEVILKEFNNFSEFMTWKEHEEKVTKSMYVKRRGQNIRKNGNKIIDYQCSRSGVYKPRGKGVKSLKFQGSSKIGTTCPAKIRVTLTSEKVVVHYLPKHENHEMQLEHLRLSQSDRTAIAGRLKEGMSVNRILEDIKSEINIDCGRKILITRKDIQNIKRDFHNIAQIHPKTIMDIKVECEDESEDEFEDEFLKKTEVLPTISSGASTVNLSLRTKLENILAILSECKFTSEQSDLVHKNLDNILDICNKSIEK